MENPVLIVGTGTIGKLALDAFKSNQVVVYGFLSEDTKNAIQEIEEVPVLGTSEEESFLKIIGKKCESFVATDDTKVKKHLVGMLNEEYKNMPVNCIHARAYVASSATLGHGNLFASGSTAQAHARIGHHNLFLANCVIECEASIGDYVQIGAGAIVGAGAVIEDGAFIGSGAIIIAGVRIGKNARVGAGSVVIEEVEAKETVFGNPAKTV
ncbi:MAG: NeuD/PglB/VioB family sugar acetyltransferase [Cytophagaceae bacterium]|jgi:sugar O-acyltransferase (sialic acid O-acetyltransferase NeuD family)|nr:NeuD/PglB/VioB family sugar acetyltransferase [Cytophagaceae bacterium]